MDGGDPPVRSVACEDQVVDAQNAVRFKNSLPHGPAQLTVRPFPQDLADGFEDHVDTGSDDIRGDCNTQPGFQADSGGKENDGGGKGGGGDHGIQPGVLAGVDQGVGIELLSSGFHIPAQQELYDDGSGDEEER